MDRFEITSGDFLKNAGIVGMKYMLDLSDARENDDYGIAENDQSLWIKSEFALNADWTDLYFKAYVKSFGPSTVYQSVLDKIRISLDKIRNGSWEASKAEKEDLKYINDKLLSNSYKSGFENIKERIENPGVYEKLKSAKLKDGMERQELAGRLEELLEFLTQPLCAETFVMKSIVYNYINRFWDGKCFLLRANAKKDMRLLFEDEFSSPLKKYWTSDHAKAKEMCVDCGMLMDNKERVSIAFMKDMADDLARKKSAFWNGKVDAFLCPVCAFVYALSPLGFQLIGNKFVFINTNESISVLVANNAKKGKAARESEKQETEKYPAWFARVMNIVLDEKVQELSNVQVILRGTNADDKYLFNVIHKEALHILKDTKIREYLGYLGKHPIVKLGSDYINVYENVVLNILQYHQQYVLLNRLIKGSIETESILWAAFFVYYIQLRTSIIRKGRIEEGEKIIMSKFAMRNSGYALRKALLESKGASNDEALRGTIYQLLNALSVKNEERFIEIVMRIYCSSKLLMPDGFVQMLGNKDEFQKYGYAFVLGLKGSHPENKEEKTNE